MPFFPEIPTWDTAVINTKTFLGLNRGLSVADGEMADMLNMCSDHYPVLSTRQPRKHPTFSTGTQETVVYPDGVDGMLGTDRLVVCSGGKVYLDGQETALTLSAEPHMCPKHMVAMGAYVCIWPDKRYINLANPDDYGDMGAKWSGGTGITAMMCRKDGANYDEESILVDDKAPEGPEDQQLWLDTSGDKAVLKQYSKMHDEWVQVATTYIKIQAAGIGKQFKENDAIHLSGVREKSETATFTGREEETLTFSVTSFSLYSSFNTVHQGGTNYVSGAASIATATKTVAVEGIPDGAKIISATVKVKTGLSLYRANLLTLNGQPLKEDAENEVPVEVAGNGDVSLKFSFQSKNNATTSGDHGGSVSFDNIVLDVAYSTAGGALDEQDAKQLEALNTTNIVYGRGDDYIIVAGILRGAVTLDDGLVAELKIPDIDYVCEANNRLWGCSYAKVDGTLTNEIRACALGDFRNWYRFMGISTDSYVMSVGSDGKFTGAYSLQGVPLMFKEDYLHKVSGTQPSNFTLNTIKCRGVQDGSWRSLTVVNETLLYKGRSDVMVYDGAMPYAISEKLGTEKLYDAVGGAYRDKYYVSMRNRQMAYSTYVYDTAKGLWHKEDETPVQAIASVRGDMILAVAESGGASLMAVVGEGEQEEQFPWSATFGVFGFQYEQHKYLSRFNVRAQMTAGSTMKLEIMYDSNGKWESMGTIHSKQLQTFMLPVVPRRCDHCQVRISGKGNVKIYSVARVFEQGGDG